MSLLDYYLPSADDGHNTAASIQPVLNGEPGNQTYFQRPSENLRNRAEVLRSAHDGEETVAAQARSMITVQVAANPPTMTWGGVVAGGGTGNPVLTNDNLNLAPSVSSASAPAGVLTANSQIAKFVYTFGVGQTFYIAAQKAGPAARRMFEGAGNIFLRIFKTAGGAAHAPYVTVSGSSDPANGPVDIVIELDDNGGGGTNNKASDLKTAFNAVAGMNIIAVADYTGADFNLAGLIVAETATRTRLFEFATMGFNGLDATSYTIPLATITALTLIEGDLVAIDSATTALRRAENWAAPLVAALVVIHDGVHSHVGHNEILPLFKVINDTLHFFNGIVCPKGVSVSLIHDYAQRGAYAAHVAGTADKHAISHILATTRPSVVVGAAAGCDYADIQSAITALTATGGTIQIKRGTYNLTVAGLVIPPAGVANKPLVFIGECPEETIISVAAAAGWACLDIQGPDNHIFENLTFKQSDGTQYLITTSVVPASSGGKTDVVQFKNCIFQRLNAALAGPMINGKLSVRYTQCQWLGFDSASDYGMLLTPVDDYMNVEMYDCYFDELLRGVYDSTAGKTIELLRMQGCVIQNCGYATAAPGNVWNYFIDIGSAGATVCANVDISHNHWRNVGAASECGGLCYLRGRGAVAHNRLDRLVSVNVTTSSAYLIYCIEAAGGVNDLGIWIHNNALVCGDATPTTCVGGIFGGRVTSNALYEYIAKANTQYAIRCNDSSSGLIQGNQIRGHSTAALASATLIYTTTNRCRIVDNYLYISQASATAINSSGASGSVLNNTIIFNGSPATSTGVYAGGANTRVVGNGIFGHTYRGVYVYASYVTVDSNNIEGTTASNGIYLDYHGRSRCVINGNYIYGAIPIYFEVDNGGHEVATDWIISGNTLRGTGAGGSTCIFFSDDPGAVTSVDGAICSNRLENWDFGGGGFGIELGHNNIRDVAIGSNFFFKPVATAINPAHLDANTIGMGNSGAVVLTGNYFHA